ncbi:hypothetical protein EV189_2329 [Motilibacter rhizosphaerae]|uniref:Lipoprotein n=1 Tax=Motilibacter rhizosphaerae TaxID=598652 RepID=A0A4Q7NNU9_9ACTN|nr:hypothetical protein [Motilibacter rhizosphaerae]RZS86911.1 hypothetical protein EV189_2329 [Motilibacter rhizosphaerae]
MRRALPLLPLALLIAACGPDDVTVDRLQTSLQTSFDRLYVRQQARLGTAGLSEEAVSARASCAKPGSASRSGAGEWTCTLRWFAADGSPLEADYDVSAKAGGCWTATGQQAVVGAPELSAPDGSRFVNPVYGIDGCFGT